MPIPNRINAYLVVLLRISPSLPTRPVAAVAIAIDCGEMSLPITAPTMLAVTVISGLSASCIAVTRCRLPNRALDVVTDPVRNTPKKPMIGEKIIKSTPVAANAKPSVKEIPA